MRIYVDADAVDLALINLCQAGDIVVTQDYGVAAMAFWKKARRSKKKVHLKGPTKRTEEDDDKFAAGLIRLIERMKSTDRLG